MPMACTVCAHFNCTAIETALVTDKSSNRRIAAQYGLSERAIRNHKAHHLPAHLVQAAEDKNLRDAIDVYRQLRDVNEAVRGVLKSAQRDGDSDMVLKASDRILRQLELQARLIGELEDGSIVNVVVSPQWIELRTIVVTALDVYPEARERVVTALQTFSGSGAHEGPT